MKKHYTLFVGAILAPLLLLTACSQKKGKSTLRLAWVVDMAEVGIFVAQDKGFYAQEGIDLEVLPGGFANDPFKTVAGGADTFGVGGAVNLLLARENGVPVVAIGAEFQETPVGFIVRPDSGIASFKDFRGKRVGVQTGADTDTLYRALLNRNGMTESDLTPVPIQYDPTPFIAGAIDVLPGYVTNQPITLQNKNVPTRVITAESQGLSVYGNVFFVSEATLRDNPELVRRFMRATVAGWKHALANKSDAIAAIKSRSKDFSDADLSAIYDAVMPLIHRPDSPTPLLGMDVRRWETTYDLLEKAGLSKQRRSVETAFKVIMTDSTR